MKKSFYPCTFSKAEADVYRKFVKEGMSHKEIAKERDCKERTSMNLLSRARKKLKKCEEYTQSDSIGNKED